MKLSRPEPPFKGTFGIEQVLNEDLASIFPY